MKEETKSLQEQLANKDKQLNDERTKRVQAEAKAQQESIKYDTLSSSKDVLARHFEEQNKQLASKQHDFNQLHDIHSQLKRQVAEYVAKDNEYKQMIEFKKQYEVEREQFQVAKKQSEVRLHTFSRLLQHLSHSFKTMCFLCVVDRRAHEKPEGAGSTSFG